MENLKESKSLKKRITVIVISVVAILMFIFLIFFWIYRPAIMQEGNPVRFLGTFFQMIFKDYIDVSDLINQDNDRTTFITKKEETEKFFEYIEEKYEVKYVDRMGSGYFFRSDTQSLGFEARTYMKFYTLWETSGSKALNLN